MGQSSAALARGHPRPARWRAAPPHPPRQRARWDRWAKWGLELPQLAPGPRPTSARRCYSCHPKQLFQWHERATVTGETIPGRLQRPGLVKADHAKGGIVRFPPLNPAQDVDALSERIPAWDWRGAVNRVVNLARRRVQARLQRWGVFRRHSDAQSGSE